MKDTYEAACDAINELGNETLIEWLTDSQAEEVSKVTPKGGWVKYLPILLKILTNNI